MAQLLVILIILFITVVLFCDSTVWVGLFAGVGLYSTISAIAKRMVSHTEPFLGTMVKSNDVEDIVEDAMNEYIEETSVEEPTSELETVKDDSIEDAIGFSRSVNPTKYGDMSIAVRAVESGSRARESVENKLRFTADNMRETYENELAEGDNRDWWGNDDL
jgi:hypothetical protein